MMEQELYVMWIARIVTFEQKIKEKLGLKFCELLAAGTLSVGIP